jgi:predicted Rossmann fold nucleotide-binding protein DprA/Smf involved in DNA uptake
MNMELSPNTQAALLLTAPLMAGQSESPANALTPGEYKRLVRFLRDSQREPGDLLGLDVNEVLEIVPHLIDRDRIRCLLDRGFLLTQAIERWRARSIWVVSSADETYPSRLKSRLGDDAPSVLYGCGHASLLETGGLAVVGSRDVDEALVTYTEDIGRLTASAHRTLISGGARGIDQAAMRGALEAGGCVTGILADSLERIALKREHRDVLMDGQLVIVSPYDPAAGFNVGHAMQRNKLIYALSDAALVVSSDHEKGGTWSGAVEQLDKLRYVPVYVRTNGDPSKGMQALERKGARPWPNPQTPDSFEEVLVAEVSPKPEQAKQGELFPYFREEP